MPTNPTPRIDWTDVPYTFVMAPTCAHCRSPEYTTQRSIDNGDGSRTKLAICKACGEPYKIVVEVPETGKVEGVGP